MDKSKLLLIPAFLLMIWACAENVDSNRILPGDQYILKSVDLPEYENRLDHAAFLRDDDRSKYFRGQTIYRNTCYACHGDSEQPGSLPNSRKFWEDEFKKGSDPHSIYKVLTQGFGQMPPQVHLSPLEKYDVIHFIREEFIKEYQSESYTEITAEYLAQLPKGDTIGPPPKDYHPWSDMDYGNFLVQCYEIADDNDSQKKISGGRAPLPNEDYSDVNFAYKGIAMRLDGGPGGIAAGETFACFDHDLLRLAGIWTGKGFIDWESILLDDQHNVYPRTKGNLLAANPITPGWANPLTGSFQDPRIRGLDGRPFGPLPRDWAHYKGLYHHNGNVILKYTVGKASILEMYSLDTIANQSVITRTINASNVSRTLSMRILPEHFKVKMIALNATVKIEDGYHVLVIEPANSDKIKILMSKEEIASDEEYSSGAIEDLRKYTQGGKKTNSESLSSNIINMDSERALSLDIFSLPLNNRWQSRIRPTGIDFINDGRDALVCTIDGEVWKIEKINNITGEINWQRIATGMFQPLGIKVFKNQTYVTCRDQIVRLHDLNGDEIIDFYESFNNDHQVTEHFHEFAMGLQVDDEGNFYYAKSGRHARTSLVPQHGTLIKVSSDGTESEILANGFRAANGVCLNPDGSFYVTDQEGYWNPMNRINRVLPGKFYGNMWGYGAPQDTSDKAMEMPLCWVDMRYDRSPAELLWAKTDLWGPLNNSLLSLSYGYGKIFLVLKEKIKNKEQGGIIELPIPQCPTGLIRGRFNPSDGQLYICGMSAWATSQMLQTGGLYRINYDEKKPLNLPLAINTWMDGLEITFSEPIDPLKIDRDNFQINTWQLKRSRRYGSDRYDEKSLDISEIKFVNDNKTVMLEIPDLSPTWIVEILYQLEDKNGNQFEGAYQGTIYELSNVPI